MKRKPLVMLLSLLYLAGAAQNALGGAKEGRDLAQEWCQSCHVTTNESAGADVAPSWSSIANDPQKTDAYLRAWLSMPQGQMEHISLTRTQINDLIAYFDSLERK